jgi:hypothetical protein
MFDAQRQAPLSAFISDEFKVQLKREQDAKDGL